MPLPALLSRRNPKLSKYDFGHVLVIAGSPSMLGACALVSLAAMRSGAGLVTAAVPKELNLALQKKIAHVVMTMPLVRGAVYAQLKNVWDKYSVVAIGPGLGRDKRTQNVVRKLVAFCPKPMVVDADALNALAGQASILSKAKGVRILTPHPGEMARLAGVSVAKVESNRRTIAVDFARAHKCVLVLKGHRTIVASPQGKFYINHTGNVGMATAGSGDVLTGMIAAFVAQGLKPFEAACRGVYDHGRAGDLAVKHIASVSLIATDLIECLPKILR